MNLFKKRIYWKYSKVEKVPLGEKGFRKFYRFHRKEFYLWLLFSPKKLGVDRERKWWIYERWGEKRTFEMAMVKNNSELTRET